MSTCMKQATAFLIAIALVFGGILSPSFTFGQNTENMSQEERQELIASLLAIVLDLQNQLEELRREKQKAASSCAQIEMEWSRVSGASAYHLFRDGKEIYSGRDTSFTDTGLVPGKRYEYAVRAANEGGLGEHSETRSVVAPDRCPPPSAPQITALPGQQCGGEALISWDPVRGAEEYLVYRGNSLIYRTSATSVKDATGNPGRNYAYSVRASNRGGQGPLSEEVRTRVSEKCPPPPPEAPDAPEPVGQDSEIREALLSAELRSSPRNGTAVREGRFWRSVLSASVTSHLAPSTIERVDVFWEGEPWRYLEEIEVRVGRTRHRVQDLSRSDFVSTGGSYLLRITGLSEDISEGRRANIRVRVRAKEEIIAELPRELGVSLRAGSVRAVDRIGVPHRVPSSEFKRTFIVQE